LNYNEKILLVPQKRKRLSEKEEQGLNPALLLTSKGNPFFRSRANALKINPHDS
jgi:hypothetical protein